MAYLAAYLTMCYLYSSGDFGNALVYYEKGIKSLQQVRSCLANSVIFDVKTIIVATGC